jgi:chromosome segregation ATPase
LEKLSVGKKLNVVRQYLSGLSYDEISAKTGVGKGTVSNIVSELKAGTIPEATDAREQIDLLRELSLDLKNTGLSPGKCIVGLTVLYRIRECGLDPADIDRWPLILKAAGSDEQAKEFVKLIYQMEEGLDKSGLTLDNADEKLQEMEAQVAQLEPAIKQVEEHRRALADLTQQRQDLVPVVNALEQKYSLLNPRVRDLEKRETELSLRVKEQETGIRQGESTLARLKKEKQRLENTGYSLETLTVFNDWIRTVATRLKITHAEMREKLFRGLESYNKSVGLDELVNLKESELKQYQQNIVAAKKEHESLKAAILALQQHKTALEVSINTTREWVSEEIAKIVPITKVTINRFHQELQLGSKAHLDDIQRLKEQVLDTGKEIGRYQTIVKENEWLIELLSITKGEADLKTERMRVILMRILRGAYSILKHNRTKSGFYLPMYATGQLIGELEKWKTE